MVYDVRFNDTYPVLSIGRKSGIRFFLFQSSPIPDWKCSFSRIRRFNDQKSSLPFLLRYRSSMTSKETKAMERAMMVAMTLWSWKIARNIKYHPSDDKSYRR